MDASDTSATQPCKTIGTFEALERVHSVITKADSNKAMLESVLGCMLDIFDCERAWLLYPCSTTEGSYQIPMECTRSEFPGGGLPGQLFESSKETIYKCEHALASESPLAFTISGDPAAFPRIIVEELKVQSMLVLAIYPKDDEPWLLGIHHCKSPKLYDHCLDLFKAIGGRISDGLTALQVTDRLRRSEQRLRILVEHAPEAIVILDCDTGQFIQANPMAEKLFGLTREEFKTVNGPASFSPEFQSDGRRSDERSQELLTAALNGDFPVFEWDHLNAKGGTFTCEIRLAALPDPKRKLLRGSITDITARKLAEQERDELEARLAQAQKMEAIGHLTGGLAHDFNNLLTIILGNLDLLDLDPGNGAFVAEQSQQIRSAAERAGTLTHRLLAFARKQPLRPQVIDIGKMLQGMQDLLSRTIGEQISIEIVIEDDLGPCEMDPVQVESAVLNLALNARDAMPEGGRLTIEASNTYLAGEYTSQHEEVKEGSYTLLAVTDSGTGIAPEILPRIFAPFFSTKEPGKGTGLGLSMIYGFVKQSGGHVKVYSEVDVGTTVKLYFPRELNALPIASNPSVAPKPEQGSRELILVVEDDENVRQMTLQLLELLNYRTLEAAGVEAALELLDQHPQLDLLLTDVVLAGDKTGAHLAQMAREKRPDLRVLYMSGYTRNAITQNGRLAPDAFLLEKPFTKQALSMRILEVLA